MEKQEVLEKINVDDLPLIDQVSWYKEECARLKDLLEVQFQKIQYQTNRLKTIDDLTLPDDTKAYLQECLDRLVDPEEVFKKRKLDMAKPIRVAVIHNQDYEQNNRGLSFDPVLECFAYGAKGKLTTWNLEQATPSNLPLVIRGLATDSQRALTWCKENSYDFYAIDTGYMQPSSKKEYHRVTKNNLQNLGPIIERPYDRLKILNWKYRKHNNKASKILICPPSQKVMKFYGQDLDTWMKYITSEIKKYTDRPIEIRTKPPRSERVTTNTIWQALDNAYCLITYNSIAATEALLYSVPAITLAPNAASVLCNTSIKDLSTGLKIPTKDKLYAFASHLSYCQFTQAELASGYAYNTVNEET